LASLNMTGEKPLDEGKKVEMPAGARERLTATAKQSSRGGKQPNGKLQKNSDRGRDGSENIHRRTEIKRN